MTIVIKMLRNINQCDIIKFDKLQVMETLMSLTTGNTADLDYLQGEHFKFADTPVSYLLCMLFNTMVMHE